MLSVYWELVPLWAPRGRVHCAAFQMERARAKPASISVASDNIASIEGVFGGIDLVQPSASLMGTGAVEEPPSMAMVVPVCIPVLAGGHICGLFARRMSASRPYVAANYPADTCLRRLIFRAYVSMESVALSERLDQSQGVTTI